MRQVPSYLLVGNGRVARHFSHYLSLLDIAHQTWHRGQPVTQLETYLATSSHVLLLISDDAIESFADTYLRDHQGRHIHFSGGFCSDKVIGAHPLQTFNTGLYSLADYLSIPFVVDHDAPAFSDLLPGLPNQHVTINKSQKTRYHALCVLSGNFSCMLWQKLFSALESEFHFPKEIAHAYLRQQMQNLIENPATALTGPLVRHDTITIEKHLQSLEHDAFKNIYASFVDCFEKIKAEEVV